MSFRRGLSLSLVTALGVVALYVRPAAAEIYVFRDAAGVTHFSDVKRHAGFQPFRAWDRPVVSVGPRRIRAKSRKVWDGVIARAGRDHGISPALVKAVIHAESLFDPTAVSHKGAQGLMQLMPKTASELGVDDPFNPWQNIEGGTRYLSHLIQRFKGDLSLGLAAYHAGERAVRRHEGIPPYRETRKYVKRVLSLRHKYDADFR